MNIAGAAPLSTALKAMSGIGRRVAGLVLPPVCMACRKPVADANALCATCWSELTLISRPYCERLGVPFSYELGPGALSAEAIADPPPFEHARAVAVYNGVARDIVHALKYRDRTELSEMLAAMMARTGRELLADADLLIPVPLHAGRLWARRFNQAALLAMALGRASDVEVDPLVLRRIRATRHQVGLNSKERDRNVRGAFRVASDHKERVVGKHVVLVDDVYTTGATVKACTRALLRGGADRVDVLVFARVVGDTDGTI